MATFAPVTGDGGDRTGANGHRPSTTAAGYDANNAGEPSARGQGARALILATAAAAVCRIDIDPVGLSTAFYGLEREVTRLTARGTHGNVQIADEHIITDLLTRDAIVTDTAVLAALLEQAPRASIPSWSATLLTLLPRMVVHQSALEELTAALFRRHHAPELAGQVLDVFGACGLRTIQFTEADARAHATLITTLAVSPLAEAEKHALAAGERLDLPVLCGRDLRSIARSARLARSPIDYRSLPTDQEARIAAPA